MLLSLSISGIFLSALLLYFNARHYRSTLYLGIFFLLLSLYSFYQYILLYSKSVTLVSLFLWNIAIISSPLYLIGPMLYWYIRSVLTDNAKLQRRDAWHLFPMIIFFIAAIPHAFVPWHEKVEAARTVVADAGFMGEYRATLLAKIFSPTLEYLTRPVLVLGYTLWSAGMFFSFLKKGKEKAVISRQLFMKKWLFIFLGFLLVLEITQTLLIIRGFKMGFSDVYFHINLLRILSPLGFIGLLVTPFFFPSILYGLPRLPASLNDHRKAVNTETVLPGNNRHKYRMEKSYLDSMGKQVDAYMEVHKPYLQPELNLSQVSVQLGVPVHHLGYFFKEVKKQPFHDYRNKWRIKHAKKLIREGKNNEITLEAIGTMSGFSNRNAFRNAFLKLEGTSPATYITSKPE